MINEQIKRIAAHSAQNIMMATAARKRSRGHVSLTKWYEGIADAREGDNRITFQILRATSTPDEWQDILTTARAACQDIRKYL